MTITLEEKYSSAVEVKINVVEHQHALDLPWARKNSVSPTSELYFPNRFTTLGEQRAAVGVDAGEVLQTDGHLAYADAKVFYQGVPLGSKEVDYGFLIDIAKLRTRSSSRI